MKKISASDMKLIDANHDKLEKLIEEYNDFPAELIEAINELIEDFTNSNGRNLESVVEDINETKEALAQQVQEQLDYIDEYVDARSYKWRESSAAEFVSQWREDWNDYLEAVVEPADLFAMPEPEMEALEGMPERPAQERETESD